MFITAQISFKWGMAKQTVGHPNNRLLPSNKKEKTSIYTMTWINKRHNAEGKKSVSMGYVLYDFIYMTF